MKKISKSKGRLKRQIVSGCVYVALSAVVVAVSLSTALSLFPDTKPIVDAVPDTENLNLSLPKADVIPSLPEISLPDAYDYTASSPEKEGDAGDIAVSDSAEGIDATVTEEPLSDVTDLIPSAVPEQAPLTTPLSIPDGADLGFDGFIKPNDGFVTVSHSEDTPVFSPTMLDYRTHIGVDVSGDVGESVKAVNGGIITEIYSDDLLGNTVCVKNAGGYTVKYSNLMPVLADGIEVGEVIETGRVIGGIGETAISEAAEASHLHLEIYDENGNAIDPEELIDF